MRKKVVGTAKNSIQRSKDIYWKKSKVISTVKEFKQRKVREGVESEKLRLKGKNFLTSIST